MALVSQVFYCFYHDELSRFQRTLTEIVLIFFRLVFTEVFSVDFRTCSIKGSFTSFERIICVFVLMPHAYAYHFEKDIFKNFSCLSIEFCCRCLS